jgi:hypothetical protein
MFLHGYMLKSKSGKIIAHAAYEKLIKRGEFGSKQVTAAKNSNAVCRCLLLVTAKWLFWSGAGLRRVFWAVVLGLGLGLLVGSGGLFICSNLFGLSMWYTVTAASSFGTMLAEREITAEASLKKILEE